ncbi:MAG: aminotransferase class V-fold PLP-dependent enzyme [Cyclobacteriaceae bacterium]|nr:aminotransferase class V-fold PLP-dependent enzyme [Cyclobacteriaceae bacterium]
MESRRKFIQQVSSLGIATAGLSIFNPLHARSLDEKLRQVDGQDPRLVARDEDFWYHVQRAYVQSPHFINLESGYFSPQPQEVLEAQIRNIRMINEQPSYYMRERQLEEKLVVKKKLAQLAGVSHEEIVITRNTTEALDTIILGMDLQPGDEAIMTNQDYGSMLETFEQRAQRNGILTRVIDIPLWPKNKLEVVRAFEKAVTPRTKVILVTHLINLTGQILPAREIADMAHERGIDVIVDAAHSFAHLDYKIPELDCDYYGTSLHKWLCAPLGAGMLYMKKEKIAKTWPLFGDTGLPKDDIRKFEHIGTHPVSTHLTLASAIEFHNSIGARRKEERLRYLKNYWVNQVRDIPGVTINTPLADEQSCALANVSVKGMTPAELAAFFMDKYKIFTVGIDTVAVKGVRVTPHLYTRLDQLDLLVTAIREAVGA